jgi:restriction endonuclease S subunit
MPKVEIPIEELETGVFGKTDYRFDLKFYSSTLKSSYSRFLKGQYPPKFVKDVADIVETGVQIDKDTEYRYLQIGDIDGVLGEVANYSVKLGEDLPSRAQLHLTKGDIVVSSVRPLLKEIAIVPETLDGQIGTNGFIVLKCRDINPQYLFYVLRTDPVTTELDRRSSALNYPAISEHDLQFLQIPYPSREIQDALVKSFDKSVQETKAIKDKIKTLTEEKDQILPRFLRRTSVNVEAQVSYTLDEIQANGDRMDVKYYRYSRKHPYEHLKLERIDRLGKFRTETIDVGNYPDEEFIQVTASRFKGIIFRDKKLGQSIKTRTQTAIATGDIVISRIDLYNGCLGRVPEDLDEAIVTRDFMVLVPFADQVDSTYLVATLKDDYLADYFYAFAAGCTGRKRITLDMFKELKIPLLRREEQNSIADEIWKKENSIGELTQKAEAIYKQAESQFLRSLGIEQV